MKRAKKKTAKRPKPRKQSYSMGQGSRDMMKLATTGIQAGVAIGITGMAIKAFKP